MEKGLGHLFVISSNLVLNSSIKPVWGSISLNKLVGRVAEKVYEALFLR